jgi:hypothetical protein
MKSALRLRSLRSPCGSPASLDSAGAANHFRDGGTRDFPAIFRSDGDAAGDARDFLRAEVTRR